MTGPLQPHDRSSSSGSPCPHLLRPWVLVPAPPQGHSCPFCVLPMLTPGGTPHTTRPPVRVSHLLTRSGHCVPSVSSGMCSSSPGPSASRPHLASVSRVLPGCPASRATPHRAPASGGPPAARALCQPLSAEPGNTHPKSPGQGPACRGHGRLSAKSCQETECTAVPAPARGSRVHARCRSGGGGQWSPDGDEEGGRPHLEALPLIITGCTPRHGAQRHSLEAPFHHLWDCGCF